MYGAVAERLREYGFLRTLEQCRTKFKVLQKSYRKVKSGHPPDTCPFFEEIEALMSAQVISLPINGLEEAASHSGQAGSDAETEEPGQRNWQHDDGEEAIAERSDSDDLEATPHPRTLTAHLHLSCSEAQVVYTGAMKKPRLTLQFLARPSSTKPSRTVTATASYMEQLLRDCGNMASLESQSNVVPNLKVYKPAIGKSRMAKHQKPALSLKKWMLW